MPDNGDTGLLVQLVGDLGSSLESSVLSAITDPAVGWLAALCGLGGNGNDYASMEQLQTGIVTIIGDLNQAETDLSKDITNSAAYAAIQGVVNFVTPFLPKPNQLLVVPPQMLMQDAGQLATVHTSLVDIPLPATTSYLTNVRQSMVPRYTADHSPAQQSLVDFLTYQQKLQAVLMQLMVEAAHQGQSLSTQAPNTLDTSGPLPPNYAGAVEAYGQYADQIAQQSTFLPLPTSGVGFSYMNETSFGVDQIVFDQTTGFGWGVYNYQAYAGGTTTVPVLRTQLSNPLAWMVRPPTYAELETLRTSLTGGQTTTPAAMLELLQQAGFNLKMDPAVSGPLVTYEALQESNWTLINTVWANRIPPAGTVYASGYQCNWFYDLLNGCAVAVQFWFLVKSGEPAPTLATIPSTATVTWDSMAQGEVPISSLVQYTDALFIYQLADADPGTNVVRIDPPLEEPSSMQITTVQNADGTTTCTASASFIRLNRTAGPTSRTLNVPQVYWSLDNPFAAKINQSGIVTWMTNAAVTVTATRGSVTAKTPPLSPPATFTPPATPVPIEVNIYPRNVRIAQTIPPQGTSAPFLAQILWSDGSTTTIGDGARVTGGQPQFQFAGTSGLTLDTGQKSSFTIPFETPAGTVYDITLTLEGLRDTVTITIF